MMYAFHDKFQLGLYILSPSCGAKSRKFDQILNIAGSRAQPSSCSGPNLACESTLIYMTNFICGGFCAATEGRKTANLAVFSNSTFYAGAT